MDVGRWTLDVGRWTLDVGRWTLDVGRWTLDKLCHSERSEESFLKYPPCREKNLPHAVRQDDSTKQAFPGGQE
ncbi:MAG: hypothetical protein K6L73_05135 [Cellvibrionaceae bacterium]